MYTHNNHKRALYTNDSTTSLHRTMISLVGGFPERFLQNGRNLSSARHFRPPRGYPKNRATIVKSRHTFFSQRRCAGRKNGVTEFRSDIL